MELDKIDKDDWAFPLEGTITTGNPINHIHLHFRLLHSRL